MRRVLIACVFVSACHATEALELPPSDGHRSALLVTANIGFSRIQVYALDREEPQNGVALSAGTNDNVYLLDYEETLDELGLVAGLQTPTESELERRLPGTDTTFIADGTPRTFTARNASDVADVFVRARLPQISRDECSAIGCVTLEDNDGVYAPTCEIPCSAELADADPPMPDPVVLTPCPTGWAEVAPEFAEDVAHCAPATRMTCAPGTAQFIDGAACVDLGDCGGDIPRTLPPGGPIIHVDDDAGAMGDGSELSPYADLGDTIAAAPTGAIIALHAGRYTTNVSRTSGTLTIVGNCARQTVIAGSITLSAGRLTLENLTVEASLTNAAIRNSGGTLTVENVEARASGRSIEALGGETNLERVSVSGGDQPGIYAEGAATTIGGTDIVVVDRNEIGVRVLGAAGTFDRLVIQSVDGADGPVPMQGFGLFAQDGPITLTNSYFVDIRSNAIAIWDSPDANVHDVLVDKTPRAGAEPIGLGLDLHRQTTIVLDRINVIGRATTGVWIYGGGRPLVATVSNIRVVGSDHRGIFFGLDTTVTADRLLAADVGLSGIFASLSDSTMTNFTVVDTRHSDRVNDSRYRYAPNAAGLRVVDNATMVASRGLFRRIAGTAVEVGYETNVLDNFEDLDLTNVTIEDAAWGGISAYRGNTHVRKIVMRRTGFTGIVAYGRPLDATDVIIEGITKRDIVRAPGVEPPGIMKERHDEVFLEYQARNGSGLSAGGFGNLFNGILDVDRIRVRDAAAAGVHIANNSQTTLKNVEVIDTPVGEDVALGGKVDVDGLVFRNVPVELVEP